MTASHTGEPTPFDLTAPTLPTGSVVLEASAGTGKTFTIAGLVTRWVAETDLALPKLLVVTFTRAATAELRDRVRSRLVGAADHLEAVTRGAPRDHDDPVLALLADVDDDEVAVRHARLHRAISEVDIATISTIHGFCQHVLDGLGIASDLDRDAELVDDVRDLVEEVCDDLFVSTYLEAGDRPRVKRDDLLALARTVVANPAASLAPRDVGEAAETGLRLHLAQRVRDEVARRARQRRMLSFDDLLTRLDDTLRDPDRGGAAREALRQRYHVALIDEFQDTDPVQWSIVSQAFTDDPEREEDSHADGRALVLIGDPKQAIYAFRGADVHAYLDAASRAERRHTLGTSWRSDAGLLTAFHTLFDGTAFGHADIPYREVGHAPGHDAPRLVGAPADEPLRLRVVPRHPSLGLNKSKMPYADPVRDLVALDLAADVSRLLSARPQLVDRDPDGDETGRRRLVPGDVAVLVATNAQSTQVQAALREVGIPSVVGGVDSVFATQAATEWRRLLDALERPASATRVRALALTAWIGWTADDAAAASEERWDRLHEDVHRWAKLLRERGVAAMFRTVLLQREVQRRLLETVGGERLLADLEHVCELAHAAATAEHLGVTGLAGWLRERLAEASDDAQEDRLRRLETDDDAVQILTVHRSKGLEFPVVYCPYLWSSNVDVRGAPVFHDDDGGRHIDVGGRDHPDHADHKARAESELQGEALRLLYVAVTRAKHQVVAWYAPAGQPKWSGLGRVLLCRGEDGRVEADREAPVLDDDAIVAALNAVAARSGGRIAVEEVPEDPSLARWNPDGEAAGELDRARFERTLDEAWRRTSYSALTRLDDPAPRVGSEPPETVKDDEGPAQDDASVVSDAPSEGPEGAPHDDPHGLREVALPLAEMPGGVHVGTFVHGVLEHTDFAAEDLHVELERAVAGQLQRRRLDLDVDQVVTGLAAALATPLGPSAGGGALRGVPRSHRRDEVEFELPLDRVGEAGRPATVADVADLLTTHLPGSDPLAGYAAELPEALLGRSLRGFLGGSIDLVLRRDDPDGVPVFHVADYKTNRLGVWGDPLTAWDYRQDALAEGMAHGHYPIQALLYAVALHRMLRWRLPGYDPERNLGSILYLFVRGMAGPDTPAPDGDPCGVFAWQPPASLVTATSDLLHGVSR